MDNFENTNSDDFRKGSPMNKIKNLKLKMKNCSSKCKITLIALPAVVVFLFLFGFLPAYKTLASAKEVYQEIMKVNAGFQNQDLEEVNRNIESAKEKLLLTQKNFSYLKWSKLIPFFGNYCRDADRSFAAGLAVLDAGDILVEAIEPYADILGFKGGKGFAAQTAEERVVFIVQTLEKISPHLEKISKKFNHAREEIKAISPNRYPKDFRDIAVREKIIELQETVDQMAESLSYAKPALAIIPQLLGEPDEKRYLLLFQNDAELRPTGGFMTAYAILKVHHGKITPLKSEDIYALDDRFRKRVEAPEVLVSYVKFPYGDEARKGITPNWRIRDMNLSPDFKLSMDVFSEYYSQTSETEKIDGIIAIDTTVPVELLKILGPIGVGGWGNFSAENDPRCQCPQVIYELEKLADKPIGGFKENRKAVLGPLMHSILTNMMGSPRKMWPEFFNAGLKAIKEKHLLLYFFDEEAQKSAENFNASGRINDYEGDYLHINDCSFSGAKSNMFIKESVKQEVEIAQDGAVVKTLTIDYKNPEPASDCNLEKGELCLNAPYRNWFRVYVPKGSELIEASGSETEVESYEDFGKTVFEGFFGDKYPLRPLGSAKLVLRYKLPFKIQKGEKYQLFIQKQPGTYGYEYAVVVDGEEIEGFSLLTDKEIEFQM